MDAEEYEYQAEYYFSGDNCPMCQYADGVTCTSKSYLAYGTPGMAGRFQPNMSSLSVNKAVHPHQAMSFMSLMNVPQSRSDTKKLKGWCKCGECKTRPNINDNICCCEFPGVEHKLDEVSKRSPIGCLVRHPAFEALCLNPWVIERAWIQHRVQYSDVRLAGAQSDRYRSIARHQFVMWFWGYLSKHADRLPACVANAIDEAFAPDKLEKTLCPKLE